MEDRGSKITFQQSPRRLRGGAMSYNVRIEPSCKLQEIPRFCEQIPYHYTIRFI